MGGRAKRVKIRADAAGAPAADNLYSFVDEVDAISPYAGLVDVVNTSFAAITLAPGTY